MLCMKGVMGYCGLAPLEFKVIDVNVAWEFIYMITTMIEFSLYNYNK